MTVKSDLQKALATCEELQGTYAIMAQSTEDPVAKQRFGVMKQELDNHIQFLLNRIDYVTLNNPLNQENVNNPQHPRHLQS